MNYISTRGFGVEISSAMAIKQGLADDGGLFMPQEIPTLLPNDIKKLCSMTYPERAAYLLAKFLTDYTYEELLSDCTDAYSETQFHSGAAPVKKLNDNTFILELWHGPTSAFKDMALQIMPKLLSRALTKTGEKRTALILVATSGDTGKAALEGYCDVDNIKIMVYYPVHGVSHIQKLQMATQKGENVAVCAINGNFDDAQNGVKKIFSDKNFANILDENGYFLSSANSINWGRLAPQVVYYISAYCDMILSGEINDGEKINVSVPTGNFGNIFAAYISKLMGLPINHLVCASNKNNILTDFLSTGIYDRNRDFYTTMSPSMDILISSNLERLIYLLAGTEKTAEYMKQLSTNGMYKVDTNIKAELNKYFVGMYCDENDTAKTIKNIFEKYNYLCDTHTAVGIHCALNYMENNHDNNYKMLAVSTASPYKFASNVYNSLTQNKIESEFEALTLLNKISKMPIPLPLAELEIKKVRFNKVIEADQMQKEVLNELL